MNSPFRNHKYIKPLRIFHWLGSLRGQEHIYLEIRPPAGATTFIPTEEPET